MNIKKFLAIALGLCSLTAVAQDTAQEAQEITHKYTDYYYQRKSLFAEMPVTSDDIVFFGNSLTNGGRWHEMFNNPNIKNRGIVGDIVQGLYDRADLILNGQPKKIFLLIGTNDISHHVGADSIAKALDKLITRIKKDCPNTQLYLQSLLPYNNDFKRYKNLFGEEMTVLQGNVLYEQVARKHNVHWIHLLPWFADRECKLRKELTNKGIAHWHHPKGGYFVCVAAMPGTAKRTLELCKKCGVTLTPAGATYPYGVDPHDSMIRIAPSLPPIEELEKAMRVFCVSLKLAALERLLDK